ncbi:YicC family protein [Agarivorans sp. B2Z047]|uniref:YicC/YloC family endoribonuclease n=1 Tax=Agarivorans sp. B2Z047 TaxID=2652721 RepID=UPI00128D1739|nr:YicC/YloC family endoribonuclease [Agarivorans sp. B2Z047]MPW31269.1 YicC family protein [Agarivorans sp. B2Z047]UQN42765.1 YicC family protein [Agarivorans sp. B2Z047]
MIHSMTGYARHQLKGDWGSATWEIRSVNQRYLETYWRMPEQFRSLEPVLRDKIRKALQRGKVECNLRFEADQANRGELQLNKTLAEQLIQNAEWVQQQAGGQINPVDILRWPGVMETPEQDADAISKELLAGWQEALTAFIESRASEGANTAVMITTRLDKITEQVAFVREQMPAVMQWQRERLKTRLANVIEELDPQRIEQEMIMVAQKIDVAEELDRLDSHVSETQKILKKGGACGRRLDFMMQEFNREANTLASKSINAEITQAAVELKVLIEQMREQIQNLE